MTRSTRRRWRWRRLWTWRPRVGQVRRAAAGGAVALAVLLVAEGGLGLLGVSPAYQTDQLGQWRTPPGLHRQPMLGVEGSHRFTVTTNDDGLRTALTPARTARTRVAIMGDSTVFGWGVDDGETLADGIAAALPDAEVLNAGQPGYSTTQVAWLFSSVVAAYQPDILIVFQPMHDFNQTLVSDRESLQGAATPLGGVRVGLARHSRIYQLLRTLLYPHADTGQLLPHVAAREARVPRVSDAERAENFDQMRAAMADQGGELMLGMLPFYHDMQQENADHLMPRLGSAWLTDYSAARGVGLVDVRGCCGPDPDAMVFPFDTGHLNAAGNARAGRAVADLLGSR